MKSARIATLVVCVVSCVECTQSPNQPAGVLIRESRRLLPAEVVKILEGSRRAIAGKAFRLASASGRPAPEVMMGANGRPRILRETFGFDGSSASATAAWSAAGRSASETGPERTHVDVVAITEYTGRAARRCDGRMSDGELVLNYEHHAPPDRWSVKARTRAEVEFSAPVFDMLAGAIPLEGGELRTIDGHSARAFVGSWNPPRGLIGPQPGDVHSLWIDVESLLPVRWSIAIPASPDIGGAAPDDGLAFLYDGSIDIHTPEGVTVPDCIP